MHQNIDCIFKSDLHVMSSHTTLDSENNKKWCNGNFGCQGFTVYNGWAYIKDPCCKRNLFWHWGRRTYTKDEN